MQMVYFMHSTKQINTHTQTHTCLSAVWKTLFVISGSNQGVDIHQNNVDKLYRLCYNFNNCESKGSLIYRENRDLVRDLTCRRSYV